jgi:membrane associated rhomboid family serine protease
MRHPATKAVLIAAIFTVAGPSAARAQYAAPALTAPARQLTPRLSGLDLGPAQLRPSSEGAAASASPTRRYVLIGAGVGAAVGIAIGAISVHNHPPDSYGSPRVTVVGLGILGAVAGALVGWLLSVAAQSS